MDDIVAQVEAHYCPPLDPALVSAILLDYDVANAEDLAIEAPIHLALNEPVQGNIHRDASGKQRNQDKGQRHRQQPTAQGSWDQRQEGSAVSR